MIQSESIEHWPDDVAGWNVAKLPVHNQNRFEADRLIGPVFKSLVYSVESALEIEVNIFKDGFATVEAEFAFEIATTIEPTNKTHTDSKLSELVSRVFCAAEIASSPIQTVNSIGAMALIPHFEGNYGLVVGPEILNWPLMKSNSMMVSVKVDDATVGEPKVASLEQNPL